MCLLWGRKHMKTSSTRRRAATSRVRRGGAEVQGPGGRAGLPPGRIPASHEAAGSSPCAICAAVHAEVGDHQEGDQGEDQERLEALSLHVAAVEVRGLEQEPARKGQDDGRQRQERDQVEDEEQGLMQGGGQKREGESGKDALEQELAVGHEQDQEGPEDHGVIRSERPGQDPLLSKRNAERIPDAAADSVDSGVRLAQCDERKAAVAAYGEENDGGDEQGVKTAGLGVMGYLFSKLQHHFALCPLLSLTRAMG